MYRRPRTLSPEKLFSEKLSGEDLARLSLGNLHTYIGPRLILAWWVTDAAMPAMARWVRANTPKPSWWRCLISSAAREKRVHLGALATVDMLTPVQVLYHALRSGADKDKIAEFFMEAFCDPPSGDAPSSEITLLGCRHSYAGLVSHFSPRSEPTREMIDAFQTYLRAEFEKAPIAEENLYRYELTSWRKEALGRVIAGRKLVVVTLLWSALNTGADDEAICSVYTLLFL